jgi:hypothetical protein
MSFKLTKQEATDLLACHEALVAREAAVQQALDDFHTAVEVLQTFATSVGERFRLEFNDKSDRWQESDYGVTVNEFICEWENLAASDESIDRPALASVVAALPVKAERPLRAS